MSKKQCLLPRIMRNSPFCVLKPMVFGPKRAISQTLFFQAIQAQKMSFTIFQNKTTPFQAINTRTSKCRKIDIFPKGLNHGFSPEIAIFQTFFFKAMQDRKMSLTIFYSEKTPSYAIKTRSSKSQKTDIFPKGLTHGFGPKMAIFPTFFFRQCRPEKCL